MIIVRQHAYSSGNIDLWRHYKSKVKSAIQLQKKNFYSEKVRHLKKSDCRTWWKLVNQLSGRSNTKSSIHFDKNGTILTNDELVTTLNQFFLSVNEDVPPLDLHSLPAFLPAADQLPTIHPTKFVKSYLILTPLKLLAPIILRLAS